MRKVSNWHLIPLKFAPTSINLNSIWLWHRSNPILSTQEDTLGRVNTLKSICMMVSVILVWASLEIVILKKSSPIADCSWPFYWQTKIIFTDLSSLPLHVKENYDVTLLSWRQFKFLIIELQSTAWLTLIFRFPLVFR